VFGEVDKQNASVLWVKALWWATQEAKRRKALQKALQAESADMKKAMAISMSAGGGNMPRAGLQESGAHQNTRDRTSSTKCTTFAQVVDKLQENCSTSSTNCRTIAPQREALQSHLFTSTRKAGWKTKFTGELSTT
jgi:hypothetical protein